MRNRLIGSIIGAVALLTLSTTLFAQATRNAPPPKDTATPRYQVPNGAKGLIGVWNWTPSADNNRMHLTLKPLPMQPWAEEKYNTNKNEEDPLDRGKNELNPDFKCFPRGPSRSWLMAEHPIEIIQTPTQIQLVHEWGTELRRVFMDGRPHPKAPVPTWQGHSIGKFEGDTLVIDTVGINEHTWLDHAGHVHSDALHLIERLRLDGPDKMVLDITIDDPKAYTKPFTAHLEFRRSPYEMEEYVLCEDILLCGAPVP